MPPPTVKPQAQPRQLELHIEGMDCAHCAQSVQAALAALPGTHEVEVSLTAQKARLTADPKVSNDALKRAVEGAGYRVGEAAPEIKPTEQSGRQLLQLFGVVCGVVLFVVLIGEWLGLFDTLTARVPWPLWLAAIVAGGFPIFRGVVRAALKRRVTSHTLMTVGVVAAAVVGEWPAAGVVVFFMHLGNYSERMTTARARRALQDLLSLAPQSARVLRAGEELTVPIREVQVGDTVVVRPGERIPVDGEVLRGQATIDQATITGEAMPVEAGPGAHVFAATMAQLGSLQLRATQIGPDTTFGQVIKLVEEAEGNRAEIERVADRFSGYYLPVVSIIALLTYLLSRDPLATAAVLVVACSCSFALATPVAMLASVGAAAKRGVLVKGGAVLEQLARADVLLMDKTGTLTRGEPHISSVLTFDGCSEEEVLALAAAAEHDSEHPLAEAVRREAQLRGVTPPAVDHFEAVPGQGVRAQVAGYTICVGNRHMTGELPERARAFADGDQSLLFVSRDDVLIGVLAASDTLRPDVAEVLGALRKLGIKQLELITGDHTRAAAAVAEPLGLRYRAELLPKDKIELV